MLNLQVLNSGVHSYPRWYAGEHGNAWNNEHTHIGGFSRAVRTYGMPYLSIMGELSAASTISFFASQNGANFYYCSIITTTINPVVPPSPAWTAGVVYMVGDEVTEGGDIYRCILAHTANNARKPPNATYWIDVTAAQPRQFHIYPTVGAEYVRLRSSADVIATVTIAAKRGA
jgi:hypothetical protein